MPVRIRVATEADAHGIATVHVASWQKAYRDALPADYLASLSVSQGEARWRVAFEGDGTILVAEDQVALIGFAAAGRSRDTDPLDAYVGELRIDLRSPGPLG